MSPRPFPVLGLLLLSLLPASASAVEIKYSYAQIFGSNSTVDLIPSTGVIGGTLNGIKCIFPSSSNSVNVIATLDGTATTLLIDPTFFEAESSTGGQYLSGWIPLYTEFGSIHVQLNNTGLGAATINCWARWVSN